jgi:hypothetical protein
VPVAGGATPKLTSGVTSARAQAGGSEPVRMVDPSRPRVQITVASHGAGSQRCRGHVFVLTLPKMPPRAESPAPPGRHRCGLRRPPPGTVRPRPRWWRAGSDVGGQLDQAPRRSPPVPRHGERIAALARSHDPDRAGGARWGRRSGPDDQQPQVQLTRDGRNRVPGLVVTHGVDSVMRPSSATSRSSGVRR